MAVRWGKSRWGVTRYAGPFGALGEGVAQIESFKAGGGLRAESFGAGALRALSDGGGALRAESFRAGALRAESFGSTDDNTVEDD